MYESTVFSVARAWHALRADLSQQSRAALVAAGAGAALLLVVNVATGVSAAAWEFHTAFFPLVVLVGGYLFSSTLFADAHGGPRAHAYLTLPISNLERGAVRLVLSTLGYALAALAGYFLVTLLGAGLSQLIWGTSHGPFVPAAGSWRTLLFYLVTSSLFLFGAIYFRRWQAFKVIMALTALGLGLALLAAGTSWLHAWLAALLSGDVAHTGDGALIALLADPDARLWQVLEVGSKIFLWAIMGPLFWVLTLVRLGEVEV